MKNKNEKESEDLSFKIFSCDDQDLSFDLVKNQTIVGKSEKCDVVLDSENYSDYEILFFKKQDGKNYIKNLHQYEELLINGKSNSKDSLKVGDVITFGTIEGILEINKNVKNKNKSANGLFKLDIEKNNYELEKIIEEKIEDLFLDDMDGDLSGPFRPLEDITFNFLEFGEKN